MLIQVTLGSGHYTIDTTMLYCCQDNFPIDLTQCRYHKLYAVFEFYSIWFRGLLFKTNAKAKKLLKETDRRAM